MLSKLQLHCPHESVVFMPTCRVPIVSLLCNECIYDVRLKNNDICTVICHRDDESGEYKLTALNGMMRDPNNADLSKPRRLSHRIDIDAVKQPGSIPLYEVVQVGGPLIHDIASYYYKNENDETETKVTGCIASLKRSAAMRDSILKTERHGKSYENDVVESVQRDDFEKPIEYRDFVERTTRFTVKPNVDDKYIHEIVVDDDQKVTLKDPRKTEKLLYLKLSVGDGDNDYDYFCNLCIDHRYDESTEDKNRAVQAYIRGHDAPYDLTNRDIKLKKSDDDDDYVLVWRDKSALLTLREYFFRSAPDNVFDVVTRKGENQFQLVRTDNRTDKVVTIVNSEEELNKESEGSRVYWTLFKTNIKIDGSERVVVRSCIASKRQSGSLKDPSSSVLHMHGDDVVSVDEVRLRIINLKDNQDRKTKWVVWQDPTAEISKHIKDLREHYKRPPRTVGTILDNKKVVQLKFENDAWQAEESRISDSKAFLDEIFRNQKRPRFRDVKLEQRVQIEIQRRRDAKEDKSEKDTDYKYYKDWWRKLIILAALRPTRATHHISIGSAFTTNTVGAKFCAAAVDVVVDIHMYLHPTQS